jgi:hypothetical protein
MMAAITSLVLLATPAKTPVLVELFTSEGCSSCPSADEALSALAKEQPIDGVEVIPLALHVDYWDYLGWSDPFAQRQFVERQEAYASHGSGVYTPQMIVNGDATFVGGRSAAMKAIEAARGKQTVPVKLEARIEKGVLSAHASAGSGTVWLAVTESSLDSKVQRGENAGHQLHHDAVVRKLIKGGSLELPLPKTWKPEALQVVAFVQDELGPVRGAARVTPGR